jgi:hypothetical protein
VSGRGQRLLLDTKTRRSKFLRPNDARRIWQGAAEIRVSEEASFVSTTLQTIREHLIERLGGRLTCQP